MFSLFDLAALLIGLSALFGWLNQRFLALPSSIGLLGMGLLASLLLVVLDLAWPGQTLGRQVVDALGAIDFEKTVMDGLLAFLLFAAALRFDVESLHGRAVPVAVAATAGVLVSTAVIGAGLWAVSAPLGYPIPWQWALVFGALISPTDAVAVLATLKAVRVPTELETDMAGESLFNDGVGVVVFTLVVAVATGADASAGTVALLFLREALGGALLGLVTGWVAYRMTRPVDDSSLEVMLSLALAMGTYAAAERLGASGPIAVVAAGLVLGSRGAEFGMSKRTRRYVFGFWEVIDYALNSMLFLLIGLEVLVVRFDMTLTPVGLAAVPLALLGRFVAVGGSVAGLRWLVRFPPGTVAVLTWGGLRGGVSIALALSLPQSQTRPALLAATYAVALFTILVQGSTLGMVARRVPGAGQSSEAEL